MSGKFLLKLWENGIVRWKECILENEGGEGREREDRGRAGQVEEWESMLVR